MSQPVPPPQPPPPPPPAPLEQPVVGISEVLYVVVV